MLTGAIATIIVARSVVAQNVWCSLFLHDWGESREAAGRLAALVKACACENALGQLVPLGFAISSFTPAAYRRHRL